MQAPESPFNSYKSKRILFFRSFNVSLSFRARSAKKTVSTFCRIQFQGNITEHFRNKIKKIWSDRKKVALGENIFGNKKIHTLFIFYMLN